MDSDIATSRRVSARARTVGEDGKGETFSIRALGKEFGVSARTLRFYEEKELINPRRDGQERIYSRRDRARLKYILMGKCVGFSLEEIREMLDLYDLGDRQVTQLRVTLGKIDERIGRLAHQKNEIDRAVAELAHARKMIEGMLSTREREGSKS
jgi:DNA-binding transcriptional MerR regulator